MIAEGHAYATAVYAALRQADELPHAVSLLAFRVQQAFAQRRVQPTSPARTKGFWHESARKTQSAKQKWKTRVRAELMFVHKVGRLHPCFPGHEYYEPACEFARIALCAVAACVRQHLKQLELSFKATRILDLEVFEQAAAGICPGRKAPIPVALRIFDPEIRVEAQ